MSNKFFKVVCVLLMIGGIMGVCATALELLGFNVPEGTALSLSMLPQIALQVMELVVAAVGFKALKQPEKIPLCNTLALAFLVLSVGNFAFSIMSEPAFFAQFNIAILALSFVLSLLMPLLYFIGAKKLAA